MKHIHITGIRADIAPAIVTAYLRTPTLTRRKETFLFMLLIHTNRPSLLVLTFHTQYFRLTVNGRKPAYWYRYGRNDKIQRDAFVNASPWIHYFWYYHHIIVRLAMLSGAL